MNMTRSLVLVAVLLMPLLASGQAMRRGEGTAQAMREAERELKIQQLKVIFNRFGQDLPFVTVDRGRIGIRSVELKSEQINSWEVSMIRSFFEESLSRSAFDYVEIPEFEKRIISSIYSTDTTFRLVNRDPSKEYRYNFDSVQSVVNKYRINQYVSIRLDYDEFFGYIMGVTFFDAQTISATWSKTYISNERGLGSPAPFTRTDIALMFLNNCTVDVKVTNSTGGIDSLNLTGVNLYGGDIEYCWQQSSSMKNTFMIGLHGGLRYVYGTLPGLNTSQAVICPRVGLDAYLGFLPKGAGYNTTNWVTVKLSGDANVRLNGGVFINSSTNLYLYPTDNIGLFVKLEYNPKGSYIGRDTRIELNTLNFGLGINVNLD